jgi:hypothetical protein
VVQRTWNSASSRNAGSNPVSATEETLP